MFIWTRLRPSITTPPLFISLLLPHHFALIFSKIVVSNKYRYWNETLKEVQQWKQMKNIIKRWTQVYMRYPGYLSFKCGFIRLKFNNYNVINLPLSWEQSFKITKCLNNDEHSQVSVKVITLFLKVCLWCPLLYEWYSLL